MKRKLPAKDCKHIYGGVAGADGKELACLGGWVIPDHWNEEASRWTKVKARKGIVLKRTEYARLLREMRASGHKMKRGGSVFSNVLHYLIIKAIALNLPPEHCGPDRKEAA